jgi:hypothetical protein
MLTIELNNPGAILYRNYRITAPLETPLEKKLAHTLRCRRRERMLREPPMTNRSSPRPFQ